MKQQKIKIRNEIDYGTPELNRKRLELVQGADPAMSEHPLGVMHVRGVLSPDQQESERMYNAGMEFGLLHSRVKVSGPTDQSQLGHLVADQQDPDVVVNRVLRSSMSEGEIATEYRENLNEFNRVKAEIKRINCYTALLNVVVYRSTSGRHTEKLRTALRQLIKIQK